MGGNGVVSVRVQQYSHILSGCACVREREKEKGMFLYSPPHMTSRECVCFVGGWVGGWVRERRKE